FERGAGAIQGRGHMNGVAEVSKAARQAGAHQLVVVDDEDVHFCHSAILSEKRSVSSCTSGLASSRNHSASADKFVQMPVSLAAPKRPRVYRKLGTVAPGGVDAEASSVNGVVRSRAGGRGGARLRESDLGAYRGTVLA